MGRPRTGKGYVTFHNDREHQRIVKAAGIEVPQGYDIHHKDENKRNNDLDNLQVLPHGEHMRLHQGISPDEPRAHEYVPEECPSCHCIHLVQYRCTKRSNYTGLCKPCNGRLNGVHKEVRL